MTSRVDALPATFMGATLKGGKLTDLQVYLRHVESKQKELLSDTNRDETKLAEATRIVTNLRTIVANKKKEAIADLMGAGDAVCSVAVPGPPTMDMPPLEDIEPRQAQQLKAANDMLLKAGMQNDVGTIRYLVEEIGLNPNYANRIGQTALHVASLWGSGKIKCHLFMHCPLGFRPFFPSCLTLTCAHSRSCRTVATLQCGC